MSFTRKLARAGLAGLVGALSFIPAQKSFARDIYVETPLNGGSDLNEGTREEPIATIGKAVSIANANREEFDNVYVGIGEFNEGFHWSDYGIALIGEDRENTIVNATIIMSSNNSSIDNLTSYGSAYQEGFFIIFSGDGSITNCNLRGRATIDMESGANVEVSDCDFSDMVSPRAIIVSSMHKSDGNEINVKNNYFRGCSPVFELLYGLNGGIWQEDGNNVFEDCEPVVVNKGDCSVDLQGNYWVDTGGGGAKAVAGGAKSGEIVYLTPAEIFATGKIQGLANVDNPLPENPLTDDHDGDGNFNYMDSDIDGDGYPNPMERLYQGAGWNFDPYDEFKPGAEATLPATTSGGLVGLMAGVGVAGAYALGQHSRQKKQAKEKRKS